MSIPDSTHPALWCGSYTADSDGNGRGIERLEEVDGSLVDAGLAVAAPSPSFLAPHPTRPVVYAVGESAQTLQAYSVTEDESGAASLEPLGDAWPAGASACHVAVDPSGSFLVVACWGDGQVISYDLDATGSIAARHVAEAAVDPYGDTNPGRQSRAHASLTLPDGRVLTTDLGYDLARIWRHEPGTGLVADHDVTLPHGSGPRHPALHPSGNVYIVTEYSIEAIVLAPSAAGRYSVTQVTAVTADGAQDGDAAAHITIDEAAEHVHVTIRGSNRIAVLDVLDGGGRLHPARDVDCGGNWPRHHLQRDSLIYVANQLSDTVAIFELSRVGVPSRLVQTVAVASPTCLVERA